MLVVGTVLIFLLTLTAYLPVYSGKFVWDDDSWTTGIAGIVNRYFGTAFDVVPAHSVATVLSARRHDLLDGLSSLGILAAALSR